MKLSFIIPAYNEEKYLGKCLDSILLEIERSKVNAEVIAVNNASTDHTRDIAAAYSSIKIVDEPRKGLSQARQSGYEASTGDVIANVDADSILPAGWIETVVSRFSKSQKLVALSGPQVFYDLPASTNRLV